jgi:hypothetical protein
VPIPIVDLKVDEVLAVSKAHLLSLSGKRVEKQPNQLCRFACETGPAMLVCPSISIPAILLVIADVHHRYDASHPFYYISILRVVRGKAPFTVNIPDAPIVVAADI